MVMSGGGEIILQRPSMRPLRAKSSGVFPRASWDQMGGFQGSSLTTKFEQFQAGQPPARIFTVPSEWAPCKPWPNPPHVITIVPFVGMHHPPNPAQQPADIVV